MSGKRRVGADVAAREARGRGPSRGDQRYAGTGTNPAGSQSRRRARVGNRPQAPFAWYGGKAYYAEWLVERFPDHVQYIEPFGGAGHVLFHKPPSTVEVYNDLDHRIVNFYRVLRDPELFEQLRLGVELSPHARDEFGRVLDAEPIDDPVENARRFFVLMRQARGGIGMSQITKRAWAVSGRPRRNMPEGVSKFLSSLDGLPEVHERLRSVTIECLPALEIIQKYDGKDALFYFDPPYMPETRHGGKASTYGIEMTADDHAQLLDAIHGMRGKAMVSGYASPLYEQRLAGWRREELQTKAHMANSGQQRTEVIWMNY
jgi:DNA adenine methylase